MKECLTNFFLSLFPEGFNLNDMFWTMIFIFIVVTMAAVVIRFVFKSASAYLHALSSAMAILFFYLFSVVLYQSVPGIFGKVLEILPLVNMTEESITLYSFSLTWDNIPAVCSEFLHILVFSLILITLDDMIPDAKNTISWIVLQFSLVVLTCIVYRAFLELLGAFDQDFLQDYAAIILVCILFTFVFLGLLKIIFTLMLVTVNPLLGAVGTWFSGSKSGQILGKSVLCAFLICAIVQFVQGFGLGTIVFAQITPLVYGLYMCLLLVLWVFTGHFL